MSPSETVEVVDLGHRDLWLGQDDADHQNDEARPKAEHGVDADVADEEALLALPNHAALRAFLPAISPSRGTASFDRRSDTGAKPSG